MSKTSTFSWQIRIIMKTDNSCLREPRRLQGLRKRLSRMKVSKGERIGSIELKISPYALSLSQQSSSLPAEITLDTNPLTEVMISRDLRKRIPVKQVPWPRPNLCLRITKQGCNNFTMEISKQDENVKKEQEDDDEGEKEKMKMRKVVGVQRSRG